MKIICLQKFADEERSSLFEIRQESKIYTKDDYKHVSSCPQGFFSYERLGLFRRVRTLITVFSDACKLFMGIGSDLFDLSDVNIVGKRSRVGFIAKKFELTRCEQILFSCLYWNGNTDHSGLGGEIFEYVERITKSKEQRIQFLKILNALHTGELYKNGMSIFSLTRQA